MRELFFPESIAVVGVSSSPSKIGHIIAQNLITSGYDGQIYFVNKHRDWILNQQTYQSVSDILSPLSVVIISVPANQVLDVLEDVGNQKHKVFGSNLPPSFAVIISAGFGETGSSGKVLEEELVGIGKKYNIRVIGPNCLGLITPSKEHLAYNGSFGYKPSVQGNISLISQSGALISSIMDRAEELGFGFRHVISLGNKVDLHENHFIEYLLKDDKTDVIACYLESFSDGKALINLIRQSSKPVVVLKAGRSIQAKQAATSHTGSVASDEKVAHAHLEKAGAIMIESFQEFLDTLSLLSRYRNTLSSHVSIITNAGGLGVITLDYLPHTELTLTTLDRIGKQKLAEVLPPSSSLGNPVDILGDAPVSRYNQALQTLLEDRDPDSIVVILTPQVNSQIMETAQAIISFSSKFADTPILPVFIGGNLISPAQELFKEYQLPYFSSPENALQALNNLVKYSQHKISKQQHPIIVDNTETTNQVEEEISRILNNNQNEQNLSVDFDGNAKICQLLGLPFPHFEYIDGLSNLSTILKSFPKPFVLKVVDPNVLHRTENNMVKVGITTLSEAKQFLKHNTGLKTVIQEQLPKGVEVFVGLKNDPQFGPTLVVGTGGIYAEVFNDFTLAPIPNTPSEVLDILKQTRIFIILSGYRGQAWDIDLLCEHICRLGWLIRTFPQISSIDVNPYLVTQTEGFLVDFKIILSY